MASNLEKRRGSQCGSVTRLDILVSELEGTKLEYEVGKNYSTSMMRSPSQIERTIVGYAVQ